MSGPNRVTAAQIVNVFSAVEGQRLGALASVAALYHPDVEFYDPIQTVRGRDAFMAMNRRLIERSRRIAFVTRDVVEGGDQVFLTWLMIFAPKLGPEVQFEGVTHIKLREGVIGYQRDYWDLVSSLLRGIPIVGGLYGKVMGKLV
jgi:hypothetical protein